MRKATVSDVVFVCPSVRLSALDNSASTERIFTKIYVRAFFENPTSQFTFHENLTSMTDTVHEDQYTFLIITRSVVLRMRNVSD